MKMDMHHRSLLMTLHDSIKDLIEIAQDSGLQAHEVDALLYGILRDRADDTSPGTGRVIKFDPNGTR